MMWVGGYRCLNRTLADGQPSRALQVCNAANHISPQGRICNAPMRQRFITTLGEKA